MSTVSISAPGFNYAAAVKYGVKATKKVVKAGRQEERSVIPASKAESEKGLIDREVGLFDGEIKEWVVKEFESIVCELDDMNDCELGSDCDGANTVRAGMGINDRKAAIETYKQATTIVAKTIQTVMAPNWANVSRTAGNVPSGAGPVQTHQNAKLHTEKTTIWSWNEIKPKREDRTVGAQVDQNIKDNTKPEEDDPVRRAFMAHENKIAPLDGARPYRFSALARKHEQSRVFVKQGKRLTASTSSTTSESDASDSSTITGGSSSPTPSMDSSLEFNRDASWVHKSGGRSIDSVEGTWMSTNRVVM